MSRIIVTRHANGDEQLVCGWDRALATAFVDLYDDEGECLVTRGPLSGHQLTASEAVAWIGELIVNDLDTGLEDAGEPAASYHVEALLEAHQALDYPASNVILDLTQAA